MPEGRRTGWAWTLGTFFGAGLGKPGPGTWGSIAALLLWYAAGHWLFPADPGGLYGLGGHTNTAAGGAVALTGMRAATLLAAIVATVVGIPAATRVARESGAEDPQMVVIDEVAGQWLALAFLPFGLLTGLLGLLLFRLFDITKPWPVRQLENLPRGWGVMVDDLGAGLYAGVLGWLIVALLSRFHG